ncbi:hypothetical protein K501DRAFT_284064 [Backusella circina FSU 941]|nr:hypothetical protein K501DRAFT_284064 [Backusella circina FSU 941]
MRFSAQHEKPLLLDSIVHASNLKKSFSSLISKLASHSKVEPTNIPKKKVVIYVSNNNKSAITRDGDMFRDIRHYYSVPKIVEIKRSSPIEHTQDKQEVERQKRHKTVQTLQHQPQQQQQRSSSSLKKECRWIENSDISIQSTTAAAQHSRPAWADSHSYTRDIRPNPNYLRLVAAANNHNVKSSFKPIIKARTDTFVWGKASSLRNML